MEMTETSNDQGLVKKEMPNGEDKTANQYMDDFKGQAQEYQQKFQDAAVKAKDFANEKISQASDKFKELQQKDPQELVDNAKDYARQKPGQALLISAAAGLVLGLLLRGGKR